MNALQQRLRTSLIFATTACAALSIAAISVQAEETMTLDASTASPSSPHQWLYDGATGFDGAAGPEIALSPSPGSRTAEYDLRLDFDADAPTDSESRWSVETIGPYARFAAGRYGAGAGTFRAPDTRLSLKPSSSDLFIPGVPMGDFSIEFWLRPTRADSGEIIMMWKAGRREGGTWLSQQVSCVILKNRLNFGFINFFAAPGGKSFTVSLSGRSVIVPEVWSHHLVRFDSATGLLEYLMNGRPEAVAWATSTGRQAGSVYLPIPGSSGTLELAQNYTGLIDEFRISPSYVEEASLSRFSKEGGTAISPILDLGATNSALLRVEPAVRTPGESAVHWSYRIGDSSAGWNDAVPEWTPFTPGAALSGPDAEARGRYVQLKLQLYPDAAGERGPAIGPIKIRYEPDEAPAPPSRISATAGNGRVTVRWSKVAEADVRGYVVYYGVSSGNYFGTGAAEGPSPVFVPGAGAESLTLNGLGNGILYFIAVAAYDDANPPHIGEFSVETSARPSRVTP